MYIGTLQASAIPFLPPQRNTLPLSLGYLVRTFLILKVLQLLYFVFSQLVESPEHNMTTLSTSSTPVPPVSMPTETFLAGDPIASRISYPDEYNDHLDSMHRAHNCYHVHIAAFLDISVLPKKSSSSQQDVRMAFAKICPR